MLNLHPAPARPGLNCGASIWLAGASLPARLHKPYAREASGAVERIIQ